ncbi:hypothetical protein O3G_MSEX011635 [Manduca sexta]|uniref:DNA-(apurinic or apyrimidinic site) endonuclease n=1 Tax=Manduca sexta TaxID=7130 RepID=A0A921ZM71_MANSE|nr:hypothetical protein O3G_MSEX011635 [Manduca sexta]KAG6459832.1 hypothetical protein O3G_MSEX011635 [Manduca sexta]KAG6459833.1 hypothetical protein O3G_MSEX011635 [Manduca sexta]KAG6459834.1 hypothetical protein O3G_MSEX011635 [Manduca sexta]KAG6459835.1 hypothetical protein O3G_MSEX011635 [Manduca sexta]
MNKSKMVKRKTLLLLPKKGRKKNESVPEEKSNDDQSAEEESVATEETEQNDDSESNGHVEEAQAPSGRGRKKQAKKEIEKAEPKPARGRKAKQDIDYEEKEVEEKPKTGRGRGRKPAPKYEEVESDKSVEEDSKPDPPAPKGRKKAPARSAKEKTPESEKDADEDAEDKPVEEPKKKETKGRKNQGKKAQAKEEVDDDEEVKEEEPASKKRKINKKEDKVKESKEDDAMEDDVPEYKPVKGRRGQKKAVDVQVENDDEPQDTGEPTKRRRKANEEKAPEDTEKKAPLKNKSATDYEEIDFSNESKSPQGKDWNFKISSWNVDGIRAWLGKGGLDYIKYEKPDILCLQEIKCAKEKLPDEVANLPGYHAYWLCSEKDGYAGVGIYTTQLAMNVQYGLQNEELDSEGRIITAEYEQFYLICTYVPNAGRKLVTLPKRLQWNEEFRNHVKELDKKKPVIICGDMNVSHNEIDLANPKTNRKNAGFTDEERSGMSDLLGDGFVDTYRRLNPDKTGAYTFWTYMKNSRSKNVGWRLDYFIVSERLLPSLCDNVIRDKVYGSDHCPITIFLHLSSADKPKE